jgi:hypothetical protein
MWDSGRGMNTKPPDSKPTEKKRDRALYARLVESYQADRIGVFVDFDRLNHPRSPIWNAWENTVPLLVMLVASLAVMFAVDLLLGTAVMVVSVFFYLFVIRPWISQRVYRRAIDAAMDNLHNWNILWRLGGLVVTLNYMNKTRCVSPEGDWKAFVTRYLPEMEMEGVEAYNAFKSDGDGKNKTAGEPKTIGDVNM